MANEKNRNIIVGVTYSTRLGCQMLFNTTITEKINLENKQCYLLWDFNINLLSANDSDISGEFLDIICSSYFKPLISKPTRVTTNTATLIDNISQLFLMIRVLVLMDFFVLTLMIILMIIKND